tara:strand:+ start:846 stop:1202 length:357 start_codon:yes stop_codon:yes gene_type:complete
MQNDRRPSERLSMERIMAQFEECWSFDTNAYMGTIALPAFGQCVVTFNAEPHEAPVLSGLPEQCHDGGGGFIDLVTLVMARGDARMPINVDGLTAGQLELMESVIFSAWEKWTGCDHG